VGNGFNEGKALDAVLRRIESRDGVRRGDDVRSPEREGHPAPIDLACTVGGRPFAFEHTGIEPFRGEIRMRVANRRLFGPIKQRVVGALPTADFFELYVPVEAAVGLKRSEVARVGDAIATWIMEAAPSVAIAPIGGPYSATPLGDTIPGVDFPLSLHRWSVQAGPLRGEFRVCYVAPRNLEAARLERLRESCTRKFPKLAAWKRDQGARTVLVLEERDNQLTNHQLVFEALSRAEEGMADAADEVFLVSTHRANPWWVTCLRRDGRNYYDDGERFEEIDPVTLTPLTSR
jgi:hypothetical protein